MWCTLDCILFIIGLNAIISVLFEFKNILSTLRANKNLSDYGKGSWAVVTACTDGIGQGFATVLAREGFNIIQVGRNPEKLAVNANDLKSKYGVQVRNIIKDFSQGPKNAIEFYEDILAQVKDLDISILVNNVGATSGRAKFLDIPIDSLLNELALNLFPICFISRLFLPKLHSRHQGAAVINLSSVASYLIMPYLVPYCSGKAFDYVVSTVSASEVNKNQYGVEIDIMSLHPGYVDTPLASKLELDITPTLPRFFDASLISKIKNIIQIQKDDYAKASLKCLGTTTCTTGHKKHLIVPAMFKAFNLVSPFLAIPT